MLLLESEMVGLEMEVGGKKERNGLLSISLRITQGQLLSCLRMALSRRLL
jgi:hypothetical protein